MEEFIFDDVHELSRRMIRRIEEFGTIEGFTNEDLVSIFDRIKSILEPVPAMIDIIAPVVIVGDLHGQLIDLLQYIKSVGNPPIIQYLFLGDYVDRSSRSLEVMMWLFCNKIIYPDAVHLLRGNHEIRRINAVYGFGDEMKRKRTKKMWKYMNDIFCELPICANVNRRILCMHGGISLSIQNWETLQTLKKPRRHMECETGIPLDLMWADPNQREDECKFNTGRGISTLFGETAVKQICENLEIDLIIRAHEHQRKGYEFVFDNRLLTIFSAPFYSGQFTNPGSVAKVSRTLKLKIFTLKPRVQMRMLRAEQERRSSLMAVFEPNQENPNITCRDLLNPPSQEAITHKPKFIGQLGMFAHETKLCKKEKLNEEKPKVENVALDTVRVKSSSLRTQSIRSRKTPKTSDGEQSSTSSGSEKINGKDTKSEEIKTVGK